MIFFPALLGLNAPTFSIKAPLTIKQSTSDQMVKPIFETPEEKARRMKWYTDARFGLFIHWGLYAVPAGKWTNAEGKTTTNNAEWIRETAQIPIRQYEKFEKQFDPVKFNANTWMSLAHKAGMQYVVITSKHHDGFNMFNSPYTDFNIMNTPWHHDPMVDLSVACKKYGLTFCFYHSIMDWHEHDYLPRRSWEVKDRPNGNADFSKYVTYLRNDVTYLLTHYGNIGLMWFDGEWENTWKEPYGAELYNLCRTLQPNIIVNNRVSHLRNTEIGDYSTPEQEIPATGLAPGVNWETCMTMNDNWGYNRLDHNYKSVKTLVRDLEDIVSKGGNFLLNVGPTAEGEFPPQAVANLKGIGAWMDVNHESIYKTTASVFDNLPWGRCTVRTGADSSQVYLHIFDWPTDGKLVVPGLSNEAVSAHILGSKNKLAFSRSGPNLVIQLPATAPNEVTSVVELVIKGMPVIYHTPVITGSSKQFLDSVTVTVADHPGLDIHYTIDGTEPTVTSPIWADALSFTETTTVKAAGFLGTTSMTPTVTSTFEKVAPLPASDVADLKEGLKLMTFNGLFNSVNDFIDKSTYLTSVESTVAPPKEWISGPHENIGLIFDGFLNVPTTDLYKFNLTSDDGSALFIDGQKVVDNDGPHGATTVSGEIALAKGFHRIRIAYFNATGDYALRLQWANSNKKLEDVPATALNVSS